MAIITSGSFAKSLWPGVNAWWGKSYSEYPDEWKQLFEVYNSQKAYEEDVGVSSFGLVPVKEEGKPILYDTEMQGFVTRYVHTNYGLGFIITKEAFEDDQYGVVGERKAKGLAFSVKTTLNTLGAAIYNNATTYTGGDGVALLASNHPNVAGGTWSNLSSSTLSEAGLEAAVIAIMKLTNDRGLRINMLPKRLVVPPDLFFAAHRLLSGSERPDTANRDINVMKMEGTIPEIAVNHYLTGTTSWYLQTNCPEGFKAFERKAVSFDTDSDWETENAKFKATFRMSFGWTDPRCVYGYDT